MNETLGLILSPSLFRQPFTLRPILAHAQWIFYTHALRKILNIRFGFVKVTKCRPLIGPNIGYTLNLLYVLSNVVL